MPKRTLAENTTVLALNVRRYGHLKTNGEKNIRMTPVRTHNTSHQTATLLRSRSPQPMRRYLLVQLKVLQSDTFSGAGGADCSEPTIPANRLTAVMSAA